MVTGTRATLFLLLGYLIVFRVLLLVAEHGNEKDDESYEDYDFNPDHGVFGLFVFDFLSSHPREAGVGRSGTPAAFLPARGRARGRIFTEDSS